MRTHHSALTLTAMGIIMSAGIASARAQQTAVAPPVATPQVQQFLQPADGEILRSSQILGIPTSHCGNVIDLMMKNQMRARLGTNGTEQLHLPHLTAGVMPGDLELLCVHLVCDGDAHQGPIFQIGMKNNSQVPIGNFHISVVGVLGRIHMHSPTATICIPRMEACEERQIQVQLPVTCMNMGPLHQQTAFDTLIVALDSFDHLMECDELNNVRIINRCDVTALVVESAVAPQPAPVQAAPVQAAPAVPAPEAPVEEDESPLDNIDLDNLELDSATTLRFQFR